MGKPDIEVWTLLHKEEDSLCLKQMIWIVFSWLRNLLPGKRSAEAEAQGVRWSETTDSWMESGNST